MRLCVGSFLVQNLISALVNEESLTTSSPPPPPRSQEKSRVEACQPQVQSNHVWEEANLEANRSLSPARYGYLCEAVPMQGAEGEEEGEGDTLSNVRCLAETLKSDN